MEGQDIFKRARLIGEDKEKGAAELTSEAVSLLHEAGRSIKDASILKELCTTLLKQKPSMAPMINLINGALLEIDGGGSLEEYSSMFSTKFKESKEKVTSNGAELIENGYRVMTYSNSSTIIETFKKAVSSGKKFEVIISEARPVREGVLMARAVRDLGLSVTLVADSALFQEMEGVNLVMVGADSLSPQYLINKIGTRGLASQARLLGKDMIAVASSEKVLPSDIDNYRKEYRPPNEIVSDREGINVVNYYFDQTPLHLISKIVTEKGPMGPFEIIQVAKTKKVHPIVSEHFGAGKGDD
jgi:translation initiation factor 2B subunit (eIF-2B alpha/beta/delta family)